MKQNVKLANHKMLKKLLGGHLQRFYNVEMNSEEAVSQLQPPYIIMPNHMGLWDPLIISVCCKDSINYITSDNQFRSKPLGWLLRQLGAIPKKKAVADLTAIKSMLYVKKQNGVIGIFPEGKRNWDGCTNDVLFSTAKLIKHLDIPVVTAIMKGGYLSRPRWAINSRRGKLLVDFKLSLTAEKIATMDHEAIYQHLTNALSYDEYAWQETQLIKYTGRRLAEKLELALYICPECHKIGTLSSMNNRFTCRSCNYSLKYTQTGYLQSVNDKPLHFDNPRDWFAWQQDYFSNYLVSFDKDETSALFSDDTLTLLTASHGQASMRELGEGNVIMYNKHIVFNTKTDSHLFHIDGIRGINVQLNYKVEFYHDGQLYQFYKPNQTVSALKWMTAIETLQELKH